MIGFRSRYKAALLLAIVAVGVALMIAWAGLDVVHPVALRNRLAASFQGLGPWAPALYVLFFWASPFLLVPAIPLSLVAGALFGPVWGTIWSLIGSTGGACLSFRVGRQLGHDFVAR